MQQTARRAHVFPSLTALRPRSMLFTLYGDYVYPRRDDLWLGTLVAIAAQLGMSEVAVRSAVARLAREGWLIAHRSGNRSFYRLSETGRVLLEEGTRRIYRSNGKTWDGRWCLLTYTIPERARATRDRLRKRLAWLGFGSMGGGVYLAPRDVSVDVQRVLKSHDAAQFARVFSAQLTGGAHDREVAGQCWDLPHIARAYERFIRHYQPLYARDRRRRRNAQLSDADAFVMRFALTHDFRRFPFIDPDLPDELLTKNWAGQRARKLFERYHALLTQGALRFFKSAKVDESVSIT